METIVEEDDDGGDDGGDDGRHKSTAEDVRTLWIHTT